MAKKEAPEWMPQEQKDLWEKAFGNLDKRKKKQSPANALTDAVIRYLSTYGCATARINTTGIYDENLGRYRFSGSTKGVEDISCILPVIINGRKFGIAIAVEIKIGKDRLSDDQKLRRDKVEAAGGHYIVAKTFDEFKETIDSIIDEYRKIA